MKIFKEEQRFNKMWIIVVMVFITISTVLIIFKEASEKNDYSQVYWLIPLIVLSNVFIFFFKLKTRIDEKGVHFRFVPFHFKTKCITWNEIEKINVRNYDAFSEFGGYGMKGGFLWKKSNGICYNVSGDIGIQIQKKNGKKILIGTQEKQKAEQVIIHYKTK